MSDYEKENLIFSGLVVILVIWLVGAIVGVFITSDKEQKGINKYLESCEPQKIVGIVPIGHKSSTTYLYTLENGIMIEDRYSCNRLLQIGDEVCLYNGSLYPTKK